MIFLDFFEEERENWRARVSPERKGKICLGLFPPLHTLFNPALKKGDEKKTRRGRVDKVGPSVEETAVDFEEE